MSGLQTKVFISKILILNHMKNIGLWHRNDLRIKDNKALKEASKDGIVTPFFIFDPSFYQSDLVSDGRIEFMHQSLKQLQDEYQKIGYGINYLHGDTTSIIQDLISDTILDEIYFNSSVSAGYARKRDKIISNKGFSVVFKDDAIVRNKQNTRENWKKQAEEYFSADVIDVPDEKCEYQDIDLNIDIKSINTKYCIDSNMEKRHNGGCVEAKKRLENFVKNISDYIGGISPPAKSENRTSQLSPYIKFGCISPRQAYTYASKESKDKRALNMFKSRLFWNQHFKQKLQDNKYLREHAVNPVFRGINRNKHDSELHKKWKNGMTGYPMVDASMRALSQTGWINFRMRAMCSSFYTFILRCWWKKGADWFYKKLIDGDSAINYAQWQMQSGLVGVHPLRIYNPRKQVRDNDPNGKFIKKYIPELKDLPSKYLDQPEKTPLSVQDECSINIGKDYPYPVVEYEKKRDEAREHWSSLHSRAKEALKDPEISRRASLSNKSTKKVDSDEKYSKTEEQSELDDFGF